MIDDVILIFYLKLRWYILRLNLCFLILQSRMIIVIKIIDAYIIVIVIIVDIIC